MKRFLFKFFPMLAMLITWSAAHAVTCNISVTSMPLSTIYAAAAATTYTGTVSGSCTPANATEASTQPYIYIGINQGDPPAGRAMARQNGTDLLTYEIYKRNTFAGIWNEGTGTTAVGTNGGFLYRMTTTNAAQSFTYFFYLRIPVGQTTKPAGIYNDTTITANIRLSNISGLASGAVLGTAVFSTNASIQHSCYFSTAPSTLTLNYTSFRTTAATGVSAFALSCTFNTPYTLAVAPTTGTALGVSYSLALSAASGTGSAAQQNFTVTGTAAAGQSGTCASSTCAANNPHAVTVTF